MNDDAVAGARWRPAVPIVEAHRQDGETLRIADCPFCGRNHWHVVRCSVYGDVRQANCERKHLPKRLRGKALYYRLDHVVRGAPTNCEVIPFPHELRALARLFDN